MLALFWSCMRHLFDAVSKQTLVNKVMVGKAHSSEQYRDWSSNGTNCFSQIMLSKRKLVSLGFSKSSKNGVYAGTGLSATSSCHCPSFPPHQPFPRIWCNLG